MSNEDRRFRTHPALLGMVSLICFGLGGALGGALGKAVGLPRPGLLVAVVLGLAGGYLAGRAALRLLNA